METGKCKHCGVSISFRTGKWSGKMWRTDDPSLAGSPLLQYCWVDPVGGSQLHEPVGDTSSEKVYTKKHVKEGDYWEILDPSGNLVIKVDEWYYCDNKVDDLLAHLNRG